MVRGAHEAGAAPPVSVVFETHATTEDNECGHATGWRPGRLSAAGREQAAELGRRRRADGIAVVLCSDLERSVETVRIAFPAGPPLLDWRLRECDYGAWNGRPRELVVGQPVDFLDLPYPGGESWRQAVDRVAGVLPDLARRWPGGRVLVVGHVATRYALDEHVAGVPLTVSLATPFEWQPGWEYIVSG